MQVAELSRAAEKGPKCHVKRVDASATVRKVQLCPLGVDQPKTKSKICNAVCILLHHKD